MKLRMLIEAISEAHTKSVVLTALGHYFAEYGIERIIWLYIPPESLSDFSQVELSFFGYNDFPDFTSTLQQSLNQVRDVSRAELKSYDDLDPHIRGNEDYDGVFTSLSATILSSLEEKGLKPGLRVSAYGPKQKDSIFDISLPSSNGDTFCEETLSRRYIQMVCQAAHLRLSELRRAKSLFPFKLTLRETEVLKGLTRGLNNTQIANEMGLSAHTVNAYFRAIFLKLNVKDRLSAAIKCIDLGLV
jgi:DNA-binding CsgD family transcriptional regulator